LRQLHRCIAELEGKRLVSPFNKVFLEEVRREREHEQRDQEAKDSRKRKHEF